MPERHIGGTHGSHWDSVLTHDREEGKADPLLDLIATSIEDPESSTPVADDIEYLVGSISGDLKIAILVCSGRVASAFPLLDKAPIIEVEIKATAQWSNGIEAWAQCQYGPAVFAFFPTDYLSGRSSYQPGNKLRLQLSGFAYSLDRPRSNTVMTPEGPLEGNTTCYISNWESQSAYPDDYQFRGRILESIPCGQGTKLTLQLIDHPDLTLSLPVFARPENCEADLTVGSTVSGVLWLQGQVARA